MLRVLSTYLFSSQPLGHDHLAAAARAGFAGIELFSARGHFNYRSPEPTNSLTHWLDQTGLGLHSVHAPLERCSGTSRESDAPISIAETDKLRRIEAVDEIKWSLELAERIPFRFLVLHMGTGREPLDGRYQDAAFNSLEYLVVFAKQRGVTIALENTPGEMAAPQALVDFLRETRLSDLRLCFDVGHAHIGEGVDASFDLMRERAVTTHIHDNRGDRDDHLVPFEGSIDWEAALGKLREARVELPLVLELKQHDPGTWKEILERAGAATGRLEKLAPRESGGESSG
ncbi:MAG TPA: sugar phosphate isomerase/epimerase family protein [Candidatus Dormibacteraeota bacterium]|nr:sugar phosphate isomerase/epimerase family protein [Candidatus Dormibacteraeota bacterium]